MEFKLTSPKYGEFTILIDDEDWPMVSQYHWYVHSEKRGRNFYCSHSFTVNGKRKQIRLHRFIMNCPEGLVVDHINHNTLDNRKENLRICSARENSYNQKKPINSITSKYKGVKKSSTHAYLSMIKVNNEQIRLGIFRHEVNAAKAYNEAALKYFGEFAYLNDLSDIDVFPEEPERKKKTSKYPGVYYNQKEQKYQAQIKIKGCNIYLGLYSEEEQAALAFNQACDLYGVSERKKYSQED